MNLYQAELSIFESFCRSQFRQLFSQSTGSVEDALSAVDRVQKNHLSTPVGGFLPPEYNRQFESIEYSFFSGGKRFRPMLAFAGAHYLDLSVDRIYPWAMAIEMIHTYSLIHDDLPSMDNDDFRRGQPTNHKIYGEAVALLAGDSLLTEAFSILSRHYQDSGLSLSLLVQELARVSGVNGMILGQFHDMSLESTALNPSSTFLNQIHLLKTGALISGSLVGAGIVKQLPKSELASLKDVGLLLGFAFQVKDDLLDASQDKGSRKNLIHYFKESEKLNKFLIDIQETVREKIQKLSQKLNINSTRNESLTQFLEWNIRRET